MCSYEIRRQTGSVKKPVHSSKLKENLQLGISGYNLTGLFLQNRTLYSAKDPFSYQRSYSKIFQGLKDELGELFSKILLQKDVKKHLPEGNALVRLKIKNKEGLFLETQENETKIADFKELKKSKGVFSIFKTQTVYQKYYKCLKMMSLYSSCAALGSKNCERNIGFAEDVNVKRVAKKSFTEYKKINDDLKKGSWFHRRKTTFLTSSNLFGIFSNMLEAGVYLPEDITLGIVAIFKGLTSILYNFRDLIDIISIARKLKDKSRSIKVLINVLKSLEGISILTSIALSLAVTAMGITMFIGWLFSIESIEKALGLFKGFVYTYILGNLLCIVSIIINLYKIIRVKSFRNDLNQFLENSSLTQTQKYRAYLKYIKKRIKVSSSKRNKIYEKAAAKVEKDIRKKNNDASAEEIKDLLQLEENKKKIKDIFELELNKEIKKKINSFKKITSQTVSGVFFDNIENIISDLSSQDDSKVLKAIDDAKKLIMKIDKASYQKLVSSIGYLTASVISLTLGTIINALAGPLGNAIFWGLIGIFYLIWDMNFTVKKREDIKKEGDSIFNAVKYRFKVFGYYFKKIVLTNDKMTEKIYNLRRKKIAKAQIEEPTILRINEVARESAFYSEAI